MTCRCLDYRAYCPNRYTPILIDSELNDPVFRAGIHNTMVAKAKQHGLDRSEIVEWLTSEYRDYRGRTFDPAAGFLDPRTGLFVERTIDTDPLIEGSPDFPRRFTKFVVPGEMSDLRLTREAWRALGSILRARYPALAAGWTRMHPANDNAAPRTRH